MKHPDPIPAISPTARTLQSGHTVWGTKALKSQQTLRIKKCSLLPGGFSGVSKYTLQTESYPIQAGPSSPHPLAVMTKSVSARVNLATLHDKTCFISKIILP